jgi:hypothetical protein
MKSFSGLLIPGILLSLFLLTPAAGQASVGIGLPQINDYFNQVSYSSDNIFSGDEMSSYFNFRQGGGEESDVFTYKQKSLTRAFFYSLFIPGLGEYYAGSKYKPYVFFGADVLLWTGYFVYHQKGNEKEDDYRAYADAHYIRRYYDNWWNNVIQTNPDDTSRYSHRLPEDKNLEYYENIGKYDQFRWGWDDYLPDYADMGKWNSPKADSSKYFVTPHREKYLEMRKDANDYFDRATTMMVISMVNHVVSAFDAAFTAKSYNSKAQSDLFSDVRIRMIPRVVDSKLYPQLTLYKNF